MKTFFLSLLTVILPAHALAIYGGEVAPGRVGVARSTVQLSIFSEGADGRQGFLCSGILVDERLVLTVAHCLRSESRRVLEVTAIFEGNGERIPAETWRTHPDFFYASGFEDRPFEMTHDIALVKLTAPAPRWTQPATLPRSNLQPGRTYDLLIAGYGQIGDGSVTFDILRQGISRGMLSPTSGKKKISLVAGAFSCRGDSGGPAYIRHGQALEIAGIISHGVESCRGDSTLTSVGYYLDWISSAAADLGFGDFGWP